MDYVAGIKACPKEPTLWILARRLKEALEHQRANSGNNFLPAETARVEERSESLSHPLAWAAGVPILWPVVVDGGLGGMAWRFVHSIYSSVSFINSQF